MNELKLVLGDEAAPPEAPIPDVDKANPMDALNRRDIELIKRSLASLHKDCAELRSTIVALHARQGRVPSKTFFLALGMLTFVVVGAVSAMRPQLDAALHEVPAFAKLTSNEVMR